MGTAFCRFPDEKKRSECRAKWIQAIRRKDWTPTLNSCLCSDHFEEKCFLVRPNKIRRQLNNSAGPSIFNFPSHLLPKPHQPRKARKQPAEASDGSSHMGHVLEDQDAPSPAKIARRINIEHSYISHENSHYHQRWFRKPQN